MELVSFVVCQSANLGPDGTFNILGGGRDRLAAPSFPLIVPTLTLVLRVEAHPAEVGPHRLGIRLVDADGRLLMAPPDAEFEVGHGRRLVNFLMEVANLRFPAAGSYGFEVRIDGQHCRSWPLELIEVKGARPGVPPAPPPEPGAPI